jgi:hypothetical protein
MPAEAARFHRRLRPRDRWFILVAAVFTVVAVIAIIVSMDSGTSSAATTCVSVERANFMGAATTRYCGADATAFCRREAHDDAKLAMQCARLAPALRP